MTMKILKVIRTKSNESMESMASAISSRSNKARSRSPKKPMSDMSGSGMGDSSMGMSRSNMSRSNMSRSGEGESRGRRGGRKTQRDSSRSHGMSPADLIAMLEMNASRTDGHDSLAAEMFEHIKTRPGPMPVLDGSEPFQCKSNAEKK